MAKTIDMVQFYKRALHLFIALFSSLFCLCQQGENVQRMKGIDSSKSQPTHVIAIANPDLKETGSRKILMGKNYRKEWTQPITVPVLYLSEARMKPTREGGGKQTRSLKAEDQDGNAYSLRSIRKYPEKAIPEELKNTIAEKIVADGISASYPYAAFSLPVLSTAAKVPYLPRKLVWLGNDSVLGDFRSKYGNALVQLEESRPAGHLPAALASSDKIEKLETAELVARLQQSSKYRVDQFGLLKARLLDNFVMNFDRHEGQWDWASMDSLGGKLFIAIPKDADQVFFINQGMIPKIAQSKLTELQGFRKKAEDPATFNRSNINFDNYFLNGLNEKQWRAATEEFLASMTDSVIELALYQQPVEIQGYSAPRIIRTLKEKRKYFMRDMMKYYRHLAEVVSIVGTNESESFQVFTSTDGKTLITVTGEHRNGIYERVFDPADTKEIRLYGLEGNDYFRIEGGQSPIKVRIIGGPGEDKFINDGEKNKIWIYDLDIEENVIGGSGEVKNRTSNDPMINEYERLGYLFDRKSLGIYAEVGFDGGAYIGARYRVIKHGFRKDPYAARHDFMIGRTIALKSYLFRYNGELIEALGKSDLLFSGEYFRPTARTNFFGLGNETEFDKSKEDGILYYRAHYEIANASALIRTPLKPWMNISYGPTFQYFQLRDDANEGKFITNLDHNVTNVSELHESYFYAGAEFQFNVSTKNNMMIPTRGIVFNTTLRSMFSLNGAAGNLSQLQSTFSFYSDFLSKDRLVLATRLGWAHNIGNYRFAQANYLGFRENLRGYRLHRFAGRTSAYNNLELRWRVADIKTSICPIAFGLIAFNDVGRVWIEDENSSLWHDGYGGGIWIAPLNRIVITGTLSYSKEEKNFPWITIGYQF